MIFGILYDNKKQTMAAIKKYDNVRYLNNVNSMKQYS